METKLVFLALLLGKLTYTKGIINILKDCISRLETQRGKVKKNYFFFKKDGLIDSILLMCHQAALWLLNQTVI